MKVRALQGETLDALCFRHRGRTHGVVEATLELNPGLADYGPILPMGLEVDIPDLQTTKPITTLINLWD